MSSLTQEEINIDLFDEVQRLRKENRELKEQLKNKINTKEFIEKLSLFRWVLENETENRIYNLGWNKDELEKELIEMYKNSI